MATHEDRMVISVGPHHPSTHGVLRLVMELEGETIKEVTPEIGFVHTGIEKSAENLLWQQAITVIDRMDYLAPHSNNLVYTLAVEELLGITEKIPERATYVRLILTELQRLSSHLVWLGTTALDLGAQSIFFYAFDMRESILDLYEEVTGVRMHSSYFRIGGLLQDVHDEFEAQVQEMIDTFPARLRELRDLLDKNPIFLRRSKGIGVVSGEEAMNLGLTGPNLRASGIDYDVRKAFPYLNYADFDFEVPVADNGDVYARYIVRMAEMEQSLRIVTQALPKLPKGPIKIDDPKISLPPKPKVREDMEALIHHFKLVSYGFDVPAGELYLPIESPRGEIGIYLVSNGKNKPWRVRVRPPSFYSVFALPTMLRDAMVADMTAIIACVDPVFGEVDR